MFSFRDNQLIILCFLWFAFHLLLIDRSFSLFRVTDTSTFICRYSLLCMSNKENVLYRIHPALLQQGNSSIYGMGINVQIRFDSPENTCKQGCCTGYLHIYT